jgi:acetolactate synthase-1/2/3 large subunit
VIDSTRATAADLLVNCLRAQGLSAVFGMPGNQNIALYDAILRAEPVLPHYLVRHEQAASMMASGFVRASGRMAAAVTVPGPGAANASAAVMDAYNDCIPLLSIVGGFDKGARNHHPSKLFHGLDQEAFYRPFTRYFGSPRRIKEIPRVVELAVSAMQGGRPGPAVIEIAPDLAAQPLPANFEKLSRVPAPRKQPVNPLDLGKAIESIRALARPVVWIGSDCAAAGAVEPARHLAELLGAPIIYGRRGKGVLSDDHPQVIGFTRSRRVAEVLAEADGLISLGARFTQIDTRNYELKLPPVVVQFDRDSREIGADLPVTQGVSGDLVTALEAVVRELVRIGHVADPGWKSRALQLHDSWRALPELPVLGEIRRALPPGGLLSVDVTSTGYNCFDRFPVPDDRSLIYPCHSVTLGFGFPAALGAKLACPGRPVVCLAGDGGFLMGAMELATAVEHQIGVVTVVVHDRALTAIRGAQQQAFEGRVIDTSMHTPDFVALARSFGATAMVCPDLSDLGRMLQEGFARTGPTVIELPFHDRVEQLIAGVPWLHGE